MTTKSYVILRNKLISLDSFLPYAITINTYSGENFLYIVHDPGSFDFIVDNPVLSDLIQKTGNIIATKKKNKILSILNVSMRYAIITLQSWICGTKIYHFGGLDKYPYNILGFFINKGRTILVESAIDGRNKRPKPLSHDPLNRRLIHVHSSIQRHQLKTSVSSRVLAYNDDWNYLRSDSFKDKKIYFFREKRKSRPYVDYMNSKAKELYQKEDGLFDATDLIVAMPMGHLGYHDKDTAPLIYECYLDALKAINNAGGALIIKPHVYCEISIIQQLINDAGFKEGSVIIRNLPIQIIIRWADVAVFSNESTTRIEMLDFGMPVLQYGLPTVDNFFMNTDYNQTSFFNDRNLLSSAIKSYRRNHDFYVKQY